MIRSHILVCGGTGCTSNKSHDIIDALNSELRAQGLENEVKVVMTGCFGLCANGPIMVVYPEGACYNHVTVDDVKEIISEHIIKGRIVTRSKKSIFSFLPPTTALWTRAFRARRAP